VSELERKLSTSLTLKSADKGIAVARFSTPDGLTVDRDRDITLPGAFQEGTKAVISPWGHTSMTAGAIPAGRATIHADGTASLKFFLTTEGGRSTFESVKELADIVEFSYGFTVTEEVAPSSAQRSAGARRVLKSLRVYEVSPVVVGAGVSTGLLTIKASPPATPPQAEIEALAADARRILAANTAPALSPEQIQERLTKARWALDCTPEAKVDAERHLAATKAAEWAAAQWGVYPPSLKWYSRGSAPDPEWRGVFKERDPGSIWLRSDLQSWDLLSTIMHECSHLGRHHRGLPQDEAEVTLDTHHLVRRYVAEVVDAE
jgi:prohead serine protease